MKDPERVVLRVFGRSFNRLLNNETKLLIFVTHLLLLLLLLLPFTIYNWLGMQPSGPVPPNTIFLAPELYSLCKNICRRTHFMLKSMRWEFVLLWESLVYWYLSWESLDKEICIVFSTVGFAARVSIRHKVIVDVIIASYIDPNNGFGKILSQIIRGLKEWPEL